LEPDSNVTVARPLQDAKQNLEIVSTDEGTQIDPREAHQEKAFSPILEILEPGSNATVERRPHDVKQASEIV
jgi:hypothetical protein